MEAPKSLQLALVSTADSRDREAVLQLVLKSLDASQRARLIAQVISAPPEENVILAAKRGDHLVGGAWGVLQDGGTVSVWPPVILDTEDPQTAARLLSQLEQELVNSSACLLQALLERDGSSDSAPFVANRYEHVTDLLYLVSLSTDFPESSPSSRIRLVPLSETGWERLSQVLDITYRGSLDCPRLTGYRDRSEVLAGYQATGEFSPERWFVIEHGNTTAGVLLLTDHPTDQQWELIYIGLVPEVRGKGLGVDTVRQAQWLVRQANRERLVLAVDAENAPAIHMYGACGFQIWDRRSVWMRFLRPMAPRRASEGISPEENRLS